LVSTLSFVLSRYLGIAKPAPEPFLTACERLDVAADAAGISWVA